MNFFLCPESAIKTIRSTLYLPKLKIIIKSDKQKPFVKGIMTLQSWELHKK